MWSDHWHMAGVKDICWDHVRFILHKTNSKTISTNLESCKLRRTLGNVYQNILRKWCQKI